MMPDLGKYAFAVLASYGATFALLAALVGVTVWHRAKSIRALAESEARMEKSDG
ncbi:heme exporter protein CcmD [Xinfangfangia sp. CPCC 101601]|uniref:Heme exporter protein D n=1 Tax=Pseudogemmobacter lacusdianii TaxID=3069608 RepID=A0ABU0VXW6_9RHOB|nr:heme exporter protein CcmD [Xinfangfangia sp. CPCC 101601]MDQ2066607.1 heme exporter protein CcmD [Xinfangfangia sp. CPCC 101601]